MSATSPTRAGGARCSPGTTVSCRLLCPLKLHNAASCSIQASPPCEPPGRLLHRSVAPPTTKRGPPPARRTHHSQILAFSLRRARAKAHLCSCSRSFRRRPSRVPSVRSWWLEDGEDVELPLVFSGGAGYVVESRGGSRGERTTLARLLLFLLPSTHAIQGRLCTSTPRLARALILQPSAPLHLPRHAHAPSPSSSHPPTGPRLPLSARLKAGAGKKRR